MTPIIIERNPIERNQPPGLTPPAISIPQAVQQHLAHYTCNTPTTTGVKQGLKKVLLIPPDATRAHSGAGEITLAYYQALTAMGAQVHILPALGTHRPMTDSELKSFFGPIPPEAFLVHQWRTGVTALGSIPATAVAKISHQILNQPILVEVANPIVYGGYDRVISIGQVVPHEVVGMANYTKNIVVGCGGASFISASHVLGAFYGIEKILGEENTPVRQLFDYAQQHFLASIPLDYVLTVTQNGHIEGLYIGQDRSIFEAAVAKSQQININYVKNPPCQWVVYLAPEEFQSTWLGNKAVYRTRMAIPTGGQLLVIAPGVNTFGEDEENDRIIRKYGYQSRQAIQALCKTQADLANNLSAAAHLIHGASEGQFTITYAAPKLGPEAITAVGYQYMDIEKALHIAQGLTPGENPGDIYYVENPAVGLWKKT